MADQMTFNEAELKKLLEQQLRRFVSKARIRTDADGLLYLDVIFQGANDRNNNRAIG